MVDISSLSGFKPTPRTIELKHPNGKSGNVGIRVTLVSYDDPKLKQIKRKMQDERNRMAVKGKFLKSEETETMAFNLTFEALLGWEWYNPTGSDEKSNKDYNKDAQLTLNGEIPEFNRKNVKELFTLVDNFETQIREEIEDTEAFFVK